MLSECRESRMNVSYQVAECLLNVIGTFGYKTVQFVSGDFENVFTYSEYDASTAIFHCMDAVLRLMSSGGFDIMSSTNVQCRYC